MEYTIDSGTFETYWEIALSRLYGIFAELLLYGILVVLLSIAAHGLYHWTGGTRKSLAIATSAMAVLATLQVVVQVCTTLLDLQILRLAIEGERWPAPPTVGIVNSNSRLYAVKDFLFATNNIVTDSLFIYRCFLVWGRNIRIVVLPILMLITTTGLAYLSAYEDDLVYFRFLDPRVVFAMVLLTNVLLMTLTGTSRAL
ncbi:hypothetical protein K438DRAFT_1850672 [Mycena galopus ATCC 62051]|nr:hypothetical protein K438DRAFT_1850672 [Mycena galopus ATCC 62051]